MSVPISSRWRRNLIRFVVFPLVICLLVLAVLSIFENKLVYFPDGPELWSQPVDLHVQDLSLKLDDGNSIHAWWCPKEKADGVLLYCHGNAGNLSLGAEVYSQLSKALNVSIMAFDYPGYGRSGGKPSEHGCYDSAEAAFDWLVSQGIPAERIILFGDSLGGGVAIELATRRHCRALVLYSTFTSAPDVGRHRYPFLPVRTLMRNRFENLQKLPNIKRPIFVAHGDADNVIPHEHSQRLYAAAMGPKALHIDRGRGHETILTPEFLSALKEFLKKEAP